MSTFTNFSLGLLTCEDIQSQEQKLQKLVTYKGPLVNFQHQFLFEEKKFPKSFIGINLLFKETN